MGLCQQKQHPIDPAFSEQSTQNRNRTTGTNRTLRPQETARSNHNSRSCKEHCKNRAKSSVVAEYNVTGLPVNLDLCHPKSVGASMERRL